MVRTTNPIIVLVSTPLRELSLYCGEGREGEGGVCVQFLSDLDVAGRYLLRKYVY